MERITKADFSNETFRGDAAAINDCKFRELIKKKHPITTGKGRPVTLAELTQILKNARQAQRSIC